MKTLKLIALIAATAMIFTFGLITIAPNPEPRPSPSAGANGNVGPELPAGPVGPDQCLVVDNQSDESVYVQVPLPSKYANEAWKLESNKDRAFHMGVLLMTPTGYVASNRERNADGGNFIVSIGEGVGPSFQFYDNDLFLELGCRGAWVATIR